MEYRYYWFDTYLIFVIFLHSHILSPGKFTLGKCVYLRQICPKAVIFSFFWNLFTLSQIFYTHGVTGVPDKYQVWSGSNKRNPMFCSIAMLAPGQNVHFSTLWRSDNLIEPLQVPLVRLGSPTHTTFKLVAEPDWIKPTSALQYF